MHGSRSSLTCARLGILLLLVTRLLAHATSCEEHELSHCELTFTLLFNMASQGT